MKISARNLKQLGVALKRIRKSRGLSQQELAKLSGLIQARISDIENGKGSMTDSILRLLAALRTEIHFHPISRGIAIFDPSDYEG